MRKQKEFGILVTDFAFPFCKTIDKLTTFQFNLFPSALDITFSILVTLFLLIGLTPEWK